MTYSIVARDAQSGSLGVAVQTCNLAVGTWVPWAEAGVGAVATQAMAERSYGTLGLDLLRGHKSPQDTLSALLSVDSRRDFRQVSIVDARGHVASHTGGRCLPEAGSHCGDGFCTQANMMARNTVWDAMARAYCNVEGDFATRLLAALDAAEAEGGDIRGRATAALLIVGPDRTRIPLVDLRVDRHSDPVTELRRLYRLHRAYTTEYTIRDYVERGETDTAYELLQKVRKWAPGEPYLQYLCAIHLAGDLDRWDEALALLRPLVAEKPIWAEFLQRDAAVNHFAPPGVSARLLKALREEET